MTPPPTNGTEKEGVCEPAIDDFFEVLADRRRRLVLHHLAETDDGVSSFDRLADFVIQHTGGAEERPREAAELNLHHNHLPRLADFGIVEYDHRSGTVRYRGDETLEALLGYVEAPDLDS